MYYEIYFACHDRDGWENYIHDNYDEMINDLKYAAREYGGGTVFIYNDDGELIEELNISNRFAAIYKIDDTVTFLLNGKVYNGIIAIVDTFGTFFDNSEPYYDIYIQKNGKKVLVKHVRQSCIKRRD